MNLSDIHDLYAYNLWANRRMFSVLDKLSDQQFTSVIQSSFPSIQESVAHILGAEWLWLMRWNGTSPRADGPFDLKNLMQKDGVDVEQLMTVPGLRSFADSLEQERQEFLRTLTDDTLHARLRYNGTDGKEFSMPLVQVLQHVVNHGTYHRGQVTTLLRQVGTETISLDLLFFYREQQQPA
ncbi:MAG: DinB family protein [Candidatus Korobacteraceae bacterium]